MSLYTSYPMKRSILELLNGARLYKAAALVNPVLIPTIALGLAWCFHSLYKNLGGSPHPVLVV